MKNTRYMALGLLLALGASTHVQAQTEGSALNYMLQRPRVAKYYKHKRAFDHLFVDAGAGVNFMGSRHLKPGATGVVGIGDWISPEHGFRLNAEAGMFNIADGKTKFVTGSLDYLLNITAIAQPGNHYRQLPVELYGVAGVDYSYSKRYGSADNGFGMHVGLRGQFAMSLFTYFYVEPRFGIMQDNVPQVATWHNFRPVGTVALGFGYRLPENRLKTPYFKARHGFADGLFLSALGGMSILVNGHPRTWDDNMGARATVGIGKWFDSYSAVRLSMSTTTLKQSNVNRMKAAGAQLDYILNLHNLFGGVNPHRTFWFNALVGGSYNYSSDHTNGSSYTWGVGGGLQANVRLSRDLNFVVEPRVDVYNERWAPSQNSYKGYDAAASVLAGFVYTYNAPYSRRAHAGEPKDALHRSSFGISAGLATPINEYDNSDYRMIVSRMSYSHWSAPLSGWRYSLQGTIGKRTAVGRYAQAVAGIDWMTDLTAVTYGCDNSRVLSLRTVAGASIGADYRAQSTRLASDVHGGLQLAFRLSPSISLTAEPQVAYQFSKKFEGNRTARIQPQVQVGLEYSLQRGARNTDLYSEPATSEYVSASIGAGMYTGNFENGSSRRLTFLSDVAYGHWFNHVSGIQGSIGNTVVQRRGKQHNENITTLRADYVMNIRSAVTGEPTESKMFQLTGLAGAQLGIDSQSGRDARLAPGVHGALQAGLRVSSHVELFLEPSATIYTKKIEPAGFGHSAEGELRVSIGTKYHF